MNTIKEKVTAPTTAAIREISVSRVAFQPPPKKRKNAGDDAAGWYKVAYSTFITMPDGRRKEIRTFSTKGMANHSTDMMKKSRDAIHSQVEELGLDVRLGSWSWTIVYGNGCLLELSLGFC